MYVPSSSSLKQQVYDRLKEQIMSGELPLGAHLVESELAHQFNVSRTPVREAVCQLITDGMVENPPGTGMVVKCPTIGDIQEIYAIIITMSDLLVKHAMECVTETELQELYTMADEVDRLLEADDVDRATALCTEIHWTIWAAAEMPHMMAMMDTLPRFWRYRCLSDHIGREAHIKSILEHRTLIDLLRDRNFDGFHDLFEQHMNESRDNCLRAYERLRLMTESP